MSKHQPAPTPKQAPKPASGHGAKAPAATPKEQMPATTVLNPATESPTIGGPK